MAKVFPETLTNDVRNDPAKRAEIKLYDLLTKQLGNEWVVFYHVAWLGRTRAVDAPRDGETDFIVAHPKFGILLIEVKGGEISYNGAQRLWISRDRSGNEYEIDPFGQVMRCKYALLNKLHSLPGWSKQHIAIGHAVAFPDRSIAHIPLPPDAPPEIIIDGRHLSELAVRVEEIMRYWQGQDTVAASSGNALIRDLERLLAPTMTLSHPLVIQMKDEEREILRLTAEQFRMLDLLRRTRRAAIYGCAGSGKTTLAVEKARRLADENFRTLLTCYNKALGSHLAQVTDALKMEQLQVCTFHQLCYYMAKEAKIDLPMPVRTNAQRIFDEDYPDALSKAVAARPDLKFDAIIVDEGQDFQDTWWLALEDCLREGRESIFYVFYDDNQRVYSDRGAIPSELPRYPLEENVRNTRNIHRALAAYYQGEFASLPRGPVGRSVEIYPYSTPLELKKMLSSLLHKLLVSEQLDAKDLVVLTPKGLNRSQLQGLELSGKYRFVEQYTGRPGDILYSTIHSFKGLERPVVIVVELDEDLLASAAARDALCYVAFSRPRNYLVLLGKRDIIFELMPKDKG
jgi:superfamily I DNA/RNA helicase